MKKRLTLNQKATHGNANPHAYSHYCYPMVKQICSGERISGALATDTKKYDTQMGDIKALIRVSN